MKNRILAAVGVLVSLALLAWVLKDVSLADLWAQARDASLGLIVASALTSTVMFGLRVVRWRLILRADEGGTLPAAPLWHSITIGFLANNVLPFRAGELIRGLCVSRLAPIRLAPALSSLVVERLFDGIAVILLLFVGLLTAGLPVSAEVAGIRVTALATRMSLILAVILVGCGLMLALPGVAHRLIRTVIPSQALATRAEQLFGGIRAGLSSLASPVRIVAVLFWSVLMWFVNGLSFYLGYLAFGIPVGVGGALLQQSVLAVGIAAPSSPGYVGVFEGAIKAVLALFGVESSKAVAFALTYHISTFIPLALLGGWSLFRTGMSLRSAQEAPSGDA